MVWTPPGGPLGRLTTAARARAAALAPHAPFLRAEALREPPPPSFAAALRRADVAVIAELKRRSPSKGAINPGLDAPAQAAAYTAGGAAALSVLTEPDEFGGALDDLRAARGMVSIPLLRKDFLVDAAQLAEARVAGASAVLLIARGLEPARLRGLALDAAELGLEVLLEVRDEAELERAVEIGPALIGVNNRDLETLAIDPATAARLIPLIPPRFVAVHESGVRTRADVDGAASAGADAVLVGSSVSAAADPAAAVRGLTGVRRCGRGA